MRNQTKTSTENYNCMIIVNWGYKWN